MGWTYTHREKGAASHFDWFSREWNGTDRRLLDMAAGSLTTLYGAYEIDASDTEPRRVVAVVALIRWVPNDWYNFGYKDMSEEMGPFVYDCPKRIYDMLTPTTNQYALEWRAGVEEHLRKKENAKGVRPGDTVRFAAPLAFTDGATADTFQFVKRSTFLRGWTKVRISNWRTRQFEVVRAG